MYGLSAVIMKRLPVITKVGEILIYETSKLRDKQSLSLTGYVARSLVHRVRAPPEVNVI